MDEQARLRRLWKRLLEPIDWEAVAVEWWVNVSSRWTRKGDKQPADMVAARQAARARNAKARRKAALEERIRARRQERAAKVQAGTSGPTAAILCAIEPGQWVTRPELRRRTGADYDSIKGAVLRMVRAGLLEQRDTGRRVTWRKGVPIDQQRDRPSSREFGLTARGRAARAYWMAEREKKTAPCGAVVGEEGFGGFG